MSRRGNNTMETLMRTWAPGQNFNFSKIFGVHSSSLSLQILRVLVIKVLLNYSSHGKIQMI